MKKIIGSALMLLFSITLLFGCDSKDSGGTTPEPENLDPVPATKTNSMKLYAHYMPWFETKESSGNNQWGYHWTMANQNPDIINPNGQRQIAAHYYPLIGPYHSGDHDVIENHLLLMKYSGIDGILIDWYGTYNINDFAALKQNTEQIVAVCAEIGLEYAIVYEDRFLNDIVNAGLAGTRAIGARTDMTYLKNNFFSQDNYIAVNGKPLLLNFGPITLMTETEWTTAFSNLDPKPTFLTLWNNTAAGNNASGEFAWVYENNTNLQNFYQNRMPTLDVAMGSAYPGFNDFYQEGGTSTVIGWTIPHGTTLQTTLQMAQTAGVDMLQLVTWNDFGEGTMLEPTVEFGYDYVNQIKTFAGVQNTGNVFEDIGRLFEYRKQYSGNSTIQQKLTKASKYFASMQPDKAILELDGIE
ncbi:glycoside hydrolase family 71/99-like protein [Flavobacterium silvaticum]|uniref:Glycosyl hydrolase family 71 n=1 Tax=Flavobacterium silvaticum TaxID=1852020 RepID=A0A972FP93_9FLAO|nr:glycoside hydrolase family 71/99-like protein [Flavobacterium silvaticum]NMH29343.1 hypothetical protein [Flavobacterium silvaticum]